MRRLLLPILLVTLSLAGCGGFSREARIESKLEKAGLRPKLARCMAHKLDEKLSDDELSELAAAMKPAPGESDSGDGRITLGMIADRLQSIDDPHLIDTVSRAGLGCAILG